MIPSAHPSPQYNTAINKLPTNTSIILKYIFIRWYCRIFKRIQPPISLLKNKENMRMLKYHRQHIHSPITLPHRIYEGVDMSKNAAHTDHAAPDKTFHSPTYEVETCRQSVCRTHRHRLGVKSRTCARQNAVDQSNTEHTKDRSTFHNVGGRGVWQSNAHLRFSCMDIDIGIEFDTIPKGLTENHIDIIRFR